MKSFDVVIVGGGMTGLALANGLQHTGLRIAVIEGQPVSADDLRQEEYSLRVSAINAASEILLTKLGVWKTIQLQRISSYQSMEVWDKDSFGHIVFSAKARSLPYLGHIIENNVIRETLWNKARLASSITFFTPATAQNVVWGENEVFMTLSNGQMLTAKLVVSAEGANSTLRQCANIPMTSWDYEHTALVATVRTDEPHNGAARQIFHGEGILAFLPLVDPHLCSIVWSLPPQVAERNKQLEKGQFSRELSVAFDLRLGICELVSERLTFPLIARFARQFATPRLALLGDSAHTIHPLAGQGVNLGFMDVAELIGELTRLQQEGKDIGLYLNLRRYERRRKLSAAIMLGNMQGFRQLFAGGHPIKKFIRDTGLVLADRLPGVKAYLLDQAMGLHAMPEWLKNVSGNTIDK